MTYELAASETIRISRAASDEDLAAAYAFRYAIYVDELRRPQKYADNEKRIIIDPLDATGDNFIARRGDCVVGVVRTNFCRRGDTQEYEELYGIQEYCPEQHPSGTAVITRLMVNPALRRTQLGFLLAAKCFDHGFSNGITRGFIDCNDNLERFFVRMGFLKYSKPVVHYDYGTVIPLVIHLDESSKLRTFCGL